MSINSHDLLLDRCGKCISYPANLLRKGFLKRQLKRHWEYLHENEDFLFEPEDECLEFLELWDGNNKYRQKRTHNHHELATHLLANHKDPKCRYIFIQAADSRSPLNCSHESFAYALTFHQVSPRFLDYVYSFGDTATPKDYSMISVQSEDSLGVSEDEVLEISKLGRSGREVRVCYLLRSAEKSETDAPGKFRWYIRQMAVYHSFDLVTGRAMWLNIKANSLMRDMINEATTELPAFRPGSLEDMAGSFAATLATHLVFLEWCDENWRDCINDAESTLRTILTKAKTANVGRDATGAQMDALARAVTIRNNVSTLSCGRIELPPKNKRHHREFRRPFIWVATNFRALWARIGTGTSVTTIEDKPLDSLEPNRSPRSQRHRDQLGSLETFSFEELQRLHHIGEQIREMRLVIQLNMQALQAIKGTYQDLMERDELGQIWKEETKKCKKEVAEFARKVDGILRSLEVRLTQLDTMIAWLNDGKALFDDILQFRSVQASRVFAEIAHEQDLFPERAIVVAQVGSKRWRDRTRRCQ